MQLVKYHVDKGSVWLLDVSKCGNKCPGYKLFLQMSIRCISFSLTHVETIFAPGILHRDPVGKDVEGCDMLLELGNNKYRC